MLATGKGMLVTSAYEAEDYETNIRAAERSHDEQARSLAAMQGRVVRIGAQALRAAALVNAGSALAMLAFIISLIATRNVALAAWLPWSLRAFVIGLLCACIGMGTAYFAQALHAQALKKQACIWQYPYVENTPEARSRARLGRFFDVVTVCLAIAAYAAAIAGHLAAYRAIGIVGFR